MSRQLPLNVSVSVALDGSGNGTVGTGPTGQGETWLLGTAACHVTTNASEAICRFYVGAEASPASFAGGTTWGSTGDSGVAATGSVIAVGTQVFAQWTGGDPGAKAYLTVTGTKTTG
jgi:hypothetical protein